MERRDTIMKKRIFSISISCFVLGIALWLHVERKSKEEHLLDAISWFIYEQTGSFDSYQALELQEITNEMLLEDRLLAKQLNVLQDTLRQKVSLVSSIRPIPKKWMTQINELDHFQPDQIDDWLKVKQKLDLALGNEKYLAGLASLMAKEEQALDIIASKLNALNLSVYSIDLSAEESIHYLHRFTLDGVELLSVIELDLDNYQVLSYQQIA